MSGRGVILVVALAGVVACRGDGGGDDGAANGSSGTGVGINLDDAGAKLDIPAGDGVPTGAPMEGDGGCADVYAMTEPETPTIMLVVDQSGSMENEFSGGMNRWESLYTTLMDPATGIIAPLEGEARFGLTLYTSIDGNNGPTCPMLEEVPPALDNYAAIDAVYGAAEPVSETPTGESIDAVAAGLIAFSEPGPKAIVLATDGEPDTCAVPNPQQGQPETLAAVEAAFEADIRTFVLSVGEDIGVEQLQEVANAGVGLDPNGPMNAPFWVALDADDLANAFDEIVGSFVSCTLKVEGVVTLDDICEATVLLDGMPLECETEWTLVDPETIEILGSACERLQDGGEHTIDATFPCGGINIP